MIKPFKFGTKTIGFENPSYIIAEIGVNHEGDVGVCAKMIEAAAKSGCDAIKLQTVDAEENYVPGTESYEIFSTCALTRDETARMFEYARKCGVDPFTTSPDPVTLAWVDRLEPAGHKISSGMMTNPIIIRETCRTGRPILMSTGLASQGQVDESVGWIKQYGDLAQTGLFQCTSLYPAPHESLNLAVIRGMEKRYGVHVGFSDHTAGYDVAPMAVCAGARIVEKHFTLDVSRAGYDHRLSLEPGDMVKMVRGIRDAEVKLGSISKTVDGVLVANAQKFLRTIVARTDIKPDDILSEKNVALKRPLPDKRGLDPKFYDQIMGKTAARELSKNMPISESDVVWGTR